MAKINEATDTDLKIIEDLKKAGWKPGDTLLYQQEYSLTPEQQKLFEGKKKHQARYYPDRPQRQHSCCI